MDVPAAERGRRLMPVVDLHQRGQPVKAATAVPAGGRGAPVSGLGHEAVEPGGPGALVVADGPGQRRELGLSLAHAVAVGIGLVGECALEPGIIDALVRATDRFARQLS